MRPNTEGQTLGSPDDGYCVQRTGCDPAPVGGNFPFHYSKIVGYSAGCDRNGDLMCKGSEGSYYFIEQNYFGVGWGAKGYSRVWGTDLTDTFHIEPCIEGTTRYECRFWSIFVNLTHTRYGDVCGLLAFCMCFVFCSLVYLV
jgi:hypothetical protein